MRDIYDRKPSPKKVVTQGSIFTNCIADGYSCKTWGLIVTPRCDMAHDGKVSTVHYVPIINYEDWMNHDGKQYLYLKQLDKSSGNLQELCEKYRLPFLDNIIAMKRMDNTIDDLKSKNKYSSLVDNFFALKNRPINEFCPAKGAIEQMVENLIKDSLPAFQLIEDWDNINEFKVVLLRDLKRLSYSVAKSLGIGLLENEVNHYENDLAKSEDNSMTYEVVANITSPYVEHIMERFSHNFCRIGVEDLDKSYVKRILIKE